MRGPVLIIAIVALGGSLYYLSKQADESAARRANQQQVVVVSEAEAEVRDPYNVAPAEGGIRGAMARAVLDAYENPQAPTDPAEIAAATQAMQAQVRQMVKARTGLDIAPLDPLARMAAAEKTKARAETETDETSATAPNETTTPAAKIVTAEEVLKRSRQERGAEDATSALKKVMTQAMNDPGLDAEIEKLLGQLDDPEKGRRIVAKAKAKGAPGFAILLGLKRQIDKEQEAAQSGAATTASTPHVPPAEPKLPQTTSRFKSAEKSTRFKSVDN